MSTRDLSWQKLNAIQRKERQFEEFKDATTGVAASLKHSSNVISYNDRQYTEDEGGSNVERERKQKKKKKAKKKKKKKKQKQQLQDKHQQKRQKQIHQSFNSEGEAAYEDESPYQSEYGQSGPLGNFDNLQSPRYHTPTQNDYGSEDDILTGGTVRMQNEVQLSRENDESNALNSFDTVSSQIEDASTIFEAFQNVTEVGVVSFFDTLMVQYTQFQKLHNWEKMMVRVQQIGVQHKLMETVKNAKLSILGRNPRCLGLGKSLNKALHDISIVRRYCQEYPATNLNSLKVPPIINLNDDTKNIIEKYWKESLLREANSRSAGVVRRDNLSGGISQLLMFLIVTEKYETLYEFAKPLGTIAPICFNNSIVSLFVQYRLTANQRAATISGTLAKLKFYVKRLVAAFGSMSMHNQRIMLQSYPYCVEVIERAPITHLYIDNEMKQLQLRMTVEHKQRFSKAGFIKDNKWVERAAIDQAIKVISHKIYLLYKECIAKNVFNLYDEVVLESDEVDQVRKEWVKETYALIQILLIALYVLVGYGSRTQVFSRLTKSERKWTCDNHTECHDASDTYNDTSVHPNKQMIWDLTPNFFTPNGTTREKRKRDRHGHHLAEPKLLTERLNRFIRQTESYRQLCRNSELVWIPFSIARDDNGKLKCSFDLNSIFLGSHITTAIKLVNEMFDLTVPLPMYMRHLFCTHEYESWYDSYGTDNRSFDELMTNLSTQMNTSIEMIKTNYLLVQYKTLQRMDPQGQKSVDRINNMFSNESVGMDDLDEAVNNDY